MQTLSRQFSRASANKYHEIYISFVSIANAAEITVDGGVPTSITLPRFTPINNIAGNSQTTIGNGVLVGFAQTGQGCVRKFIVNGIAADLQGT